MLTRSSPLVALLLLAACVGMAADASHPFRWLTSSVRSRLLWQEVAPRLREPAELWEPHEDCPKIIESVAKPLAPHSDGDWEDWLQRVIGRGAGPDVLDPALARRLSALPEALKQKLLHRIAREFRAARKLYREHEEGLTPRRALDFVLGALLDPRGHFQSALASGASPLQAYEGYLEQVREVVGEENSYRAAQVVEVGRIAARALAWQLDFARRLDSYARELAIYASLPFHRRWRTAEPQPALGLGLGPARLELERKTFAAARAVLRGARAETCKAYATSTPVALGQERIVVTGSFPNGRAVFRPRPGEEAGHKSDIDVMILASNGLGQLLTPGGALRLVREELDPQGRASTSIPFSQAVANPLAEGPELFLARMLSPVALLISPRGAQLMVFATDGSNAPPLVLQLVLGD